MPTHMTCPRGHHWDLGEEDATVDRRGPAACPVCGSALSPASGPADRPEPADLTIRSGSTNSPGDRPDPSDPEHEDLIRRFEQDWFAGRDPTLEEYLDGADLTDHRLLIELVHIDLEFRIKAGQSARAGDYLTRFPKLSADETATELIGAEYEFRRRMTPGLRFDEVAAGYPRYRDRLESYRARFARSTPWASPARAESHTWPAPPGYEILSTLGVGGMGVVYQARQVRADRVVALKIPLAAATDPEARVRFSTEGRAAARLQHPGIVQVFEVGEADQVPYMALEFCPGGSLVDRLDGTPLTPRAAAELVETVAQAVGAANAAGVVHRDLKPGNILFGKEGGTTSEGGTATPVTGSESAFRLHPASFLPKVSDFGLARRLDEEQSHTRTGTVVGTPVYMAPEQARGDPRQIGPPTDVYALGAILYELLTGRPPFRGPSALDTMRQVCTDDPVPPSRLQPGIPRDLETICLKCLHKSPARRYPTGDALADDLRRFLDGRPVLARPVGWTERLAKRVRRNPVPATLLAALAAVVVGGVTWGVWKQFRVVAERDRARAHFQMSMRAIDGFLTEVAEDELASEPRAELKRKALLEKALGFYEELLRVEPDDPLVKWEAARAARRVGDIYRHLGRYPEALTAYDQATDRLRQLPPGPGPRQEVALCHNYRGEVYRLTEKPDEADAEYQQAIVIQFAAVEEHPGHPEYTRELAQSYYNRGIVATNTGRYTDAREFFQQAGRVLDESPDGTPEHRRHRARVWINLANVLWLDEKPHDAAAAAAEAAVGILDGLVKLPDARPEYRYELAAALLNLANARGAGGDRSAAVESNARALGLLEKLVADFQNTPAYRAELARAHNGAATLAYARDRPAAEEHVRKAVTHWEALVRAHDGVPAHHGELGMALGNLGRIVRGRPEEAREYLTRGVAEVIRVLQANPGDETFRQSLRQQARDLADLLVRAGDHDAARALAEKMARELPKGSLGTYRAVCFLARCATTARNFLGPLADVDRRVEEYTGLALKLIQASNAADLARLIDDPDCDPFRHQKQFRAALARTGR
ncbi:MAG TPA: serine/threonine-protein kinase [Fimbriiglobus sp.]|nr:serine/threonine-protein kinase [Fimbriiglobus sp.]